ncbi:AIPR family protein [Dickeya dadantii]|uniref:AIPR family protein n=1 Tax=Dickeya dadantii TaxID=204038 RepID=UPI001CC81A23|nr:AIPR family protein [Dickeya dadantii]UAY96851.1 AIPR family protein [Dickeya dadantii]
MLDPILQHHLNKFTTSFEINMSGGNSEENKKLESKSFEKFVNYVLFSIDDPGIFTGDIELLDLISVGGGNDTGIDGVGIRINDKFVRSKKEVSDIARDSKKLSVDFFFVQSKLTSGFNLGEFSKFSLGIKNFFAEGYLPENQQVKEVKDIKNFLYSDEKIISKLDNAPTLNIYYVTTGGDSTSDLNFLGAKSALEDDLRRTNLFFEKILIEYIGGKQLIKFCKELENKFEVFLNVQDIIPLIVNMDNEDDIKKSYAFTCKAPEFLKILKKEDGQLRRSLFNSNVRDYLGNRGNVNSEIEKTIKNEPELFLLCNNGVTIVCTGFEQIKDKLVKIENPQIVNGCQTSNSIFHLSKNDNIERVQVLVRLISTENLSIANNIVRGTNKQNQVLDEAFEATLPFHQDILEPFFLTYEKDVSLYYERRAKQYNNDSKIKKTQIVNLRILIQAFVSIFLELPHESHLHEAKLLEQYGGDIKKRKVFLENHEPLIYYYCALVWYMFEKSIRDNKISYKYKTYKQHLYYIFRKLTTPLPGTLDKSRVTSKFCERLLLSLSPEQYDKNLAKTLKLFDEAQEKWNDMGRSVYGIKDNKEFTDLINSIVKSSNLSFSFDLDDEKLAIPKKYTGKIINIIHRQDAWFGFIEQDLENDNMYFDKRGFSGNAKDLKPEMILEYELGSNAQGDMAINVKVI